jgi:hypothetical protein
VIDRARHPFLNWPLQVSDPVFGHVWFAHPAVIVTQTTVEHGNVAWASYVHDQIDQVLDVAGDEVAQNGGLLFIHDFRSMTSYDKDARLEYLARMRRRASGYSRGTVVAIRMDQPLLRMGIQAANLLMAVAIKAPLSMVSDPTDAVATEVKRPPSPDERFPGRSPRSRWPGA